MEESIRLVTSTAREAAGKSPCTTHPAFCVLRSAAVSRSVICKLELDVHFTIVPGMHSHRLYQCHYLAALGFPVNRGSTGEGSFPSPSQID